MLDCVLCKEHYAYITHDMLYCYTTEMYYLMYLYTRLFSLLKHLRYYSWQAILFAVLKCIASINSETYWWRIFSLCHALKINQPIIVSQICTVSFRKETRRWWYEEHLAKSFQCSISSNFPSSGQLHKVKRCHVYNTVSLTMKRPQHRPCILTMKITLLQ